MKTLMEWLLNNKHMTVIIDIYDKSLNFIKIFNHINIQFSNVKKSKLKQHFYVTVLCICIKLYSLAFYEFKGGLGGDLLVEKQHYRPNVRPTIRPYKMLFLYEKCCIILIKK